MKGVHSTVGIREQIWLWICRERESGAVMEGTHIFEETYELTDAKLGQGCHGNV